ncbi:MAG: hypothetical protein MUO53_10110 [Maribacter sp.]|nr:hypothetical protein [Maribacter sp.]
MKKVCTILFACALSFQIAMAQSVTSHQYRRVAPENMEEYLKRETTYWQKWAENEVNKGNLTFWGVFQKVGGTDMEHEPNILIINTYKDIDKGADWAGITKIFPNVKMEDMSPWGLSTDTDQIFLRDLDNHIQAANVVPSNDFKYVRFIYHNTKDNAAELSFEADKWKPMLVKAMQDGKTIMKGWGNSVVISPQSDKFPYSSASYDLFSSMQDALSPAFSADLVWPDGFFDGLTAHVAGPRNSNLYRIVSVVTPTPSN